MKMDRIRHGHDRSVQKDHASAARARRKLKAWVEPPPIDARDLGEIRALLSTPLDAKKADPKNPQFEPLKELPPAPLSPPRRDRLPEPEGVLQGWWQKALEVLQGRASTSEISRARRVVGQVRDLEARFRKMSDAELSGQTEIFRGLIKEKTAQEAKALEAAEGTLAAAPFEDRNELREKVIAARVALYKAERKVLDAILPEAFATVREAGRRATGLYPYEVQVLAGALMHRGMAAEMYTGEGKTLAATLPAYLNALAGHGFHVVTVNDYLAKRDADEMGSIYGFVGLSVGVLQNQQKQLGLDPPAKWDGKPAELHPITRKEAYQCDITYGTASEFGFDYLRDNGVRSLGDRVQRPLYGALIDEVDAILIDEARTPLIIAEQGPNPDKEALIRFREIASALEWEPPKDKLVGDVEWNQKDNWVSLTESGEEKVANALGVENLFTTESSDKLRQVYEALQARFLLRADEDYAILDGKVVTVGKNGHAMAGRRFTAGLHQALEAKENVEILPDTLTRASVTMRDYFAMYALTCGMTGTALSARDVLSKVYRLEVARVPTREKLIRVDHPDVVVRTREEKKAAFIEDVLKAHATGRPILIGVEWTSTAEELAKELGAKGLPVEVLTAKDDHEEARIIANAGRLNAITVVTTRGGRGVDIKLGGNPRIITESILTESILKGDRPNASEVYAKEAKACALERASVLAKGGLLVMGYEHLDSRRRDDQLRGRAGRQGDPGATIFYTSLEDVLYDGVKEAEKMRSGEAPFDVEQARWLTETALTRSENRVTDALTQSLPYDRIAAIHRNRFYELRDDVLAVGDARRVAKAAIEDALNDTFEKIDASLFTKHPQRISEDQAKELYRLLADLLPLPENGPPPDWTEKPIDAIRADIDDIVRELLARRDKAVGEEINRVLEREALIEALDESWIQHLDGLQSIRDGIGLRAIGQKDPKIEYQKEAAQLFGELFDIVRARLAAKLLKTIPMFKNADLAR